MKFRRVSLKLQSAATVCVGSVLLFTFSCATPPLYGGVDYELQDDEVGVRIDLDGWEIYRDAAAAPPILRPAFDVENPPLFLALRGEDVLTAVARRAEGIDSRAFFEIFAMGVQEQGEITSALQLKQSGGVLFTSRVGQGVGLVHTRSLVHVFEGRVLSLVLLNHREVPSEDRFLQALQGVELQTGPGWIAPWRSEASLVAEPLPGYAAESVEPMDVFQAVDCPAGGQPMLWVVPTASGRLHLFGSIHFGHSSFYPFAPAIEVAFEGAKRLAVEIDVRHAGRAARSSGQGARGLPAGQSLADVLPPDLYRRLESAAAELGLPLSIFDEMSPGAAGMLLSTVPYLARGFDPADGVDLYFLGRARDKRIVELETVSAQLGLIDSLENEFLSSALDGLETVDEDLDALHRAWRCGDVESLEYLIYDLSRERASTPEEHGFIDDFNETFFVSRNRRMTQAILDLLPLEGDSFVVVGAAHLVGEQGIPALLREAGHVVERVGP